MPALRLSHKLFLAFALIVGVVLTLAGWSLLTTRRLTVENRTIIERTLPAARAEVTLLEGVGALRRLEARYAVLRDSAYLRLFAERADAIEGDLAVLADLVSTDAERRTVAEATAHLRSYRALAERPPGDRARTEQAALRFEELAQHLYGRSSAELQKRAALVSGLEAQSRWVAILAIVASVGVAVAVAVFASLRIARPLRRLRTAVRAVERRQFSQPIAVHGRDEVAELTAAFNRMAERLRELDALRQHLFSSITHDLRTPLTVIAWSAERLAQGAPGTRGERQASLIENIRMNTSRLLNLVSQLLDLGKLKAGKLQLDLGLTDVAALIQDAVEEIRPWAEDRSLRFSVTVPDTMPKLLLDEKRIHQALVNLLANAVKFNKPAGLITVTAEATHREAVVRVLDTGVGIPARLHAKIFERYEQAEAHATGTGLGLAVVKAFVEAHGGRVWVESEEGHGSCFGFTLPLEVPDP